MRKLSSKSQDLFLSVLTGIIPSVPWHNMGSGFVLMFGFVPVLFRVDGHSSRPENQDEELLSIHESHLHQGASWGADEFSFLRCRSGKLIFRT
jgi:hypothetical protein